MKTYERNRHTMDWLKNPGFFGTHATIGADISQLMATFFTGAVRDRLDSGTKRQSDAHHWLMLGGMVAMLGFFVSYYLFRQLGVLAFEGKEGFGGSEALYHNVFIPLLTFHIILVIIGLVMAVYMIVLGFRAQMIERGSTDPERSHPPDDVGKDRHHLWCSLRAGGGVLAVSGGGRSFSMGRLVVWVGLLALIAIVFAVEMTIQRIWPDGGQRHRTLGRFTMIIYCVLFVTGTTTYTMLYILYPGKIG